MNETKILKAFCRKTGNYYCLEVCKFGRDWKVVNMAGMTDDEAKNVASEVKPESLQTADSLIACSGCGSRKVGGCACPKNKHNCSRGMGYQFDCVYCNELSIDYSLPKRTEGSYREGDVIKLAQGHEVKIRYADDRPLSQIYVGVGWDPASPSANDIDVDSSVFVMSGQTGAFELVYFGDKTHPSGCVIHHGDNLTGEDIPGQDDENISVYLNKVPRDRDRLIFVLNIYKCRERRQTFGKIKNLYIRLYDPDSKKALIEYCITGNYKNDTSLIIGMAYKKDGSWVFKAIGKSSDAADLNEVAEECLRECRW